NQALKTMAPRGARAGLPQVIVNDLDKRVGPAPVLGGGGESILTRRAFAMWKHLVQSRLTHIHQGLAAEAIGLGFGMMENGHQVTSSGIISDVSDWSVRVASKRTTAAGACPDSTPGLSAVTSRAPSRAPGVSRAAPAQRPHANSPSCTRRQAW